MRFLEAIAQADTLRPNQIDTETKAGWLQRLDMEVGQMMRRDPEDSWPQDRELLMPKPHDRIYPLYLAAQIDYYQGETDLYVNDADVYQGALREARSWWRRNNLPEHPGNWKVW